MSFVLVRLKGFEPPTFWFVAKHSIQLSYSRILKFFARLPDGLISIAQEAGFGKPFFEKIQKIFAGRKMCVKLDFFHVLVRKNGFFVQRKEKPLTGAVPAWAEPGLWRDRGTKRRFCVWRNERAFPPGWVFC